MKPIKLLGLVLGLALSLTLVTAALANEGGSASEYSCNQDPVYERNFNGQVIMALRLRNMPCMAESEVIRVLEKGKIVPVIAEMDGWYKVKDTDGTTGWVGATLISKTTADVAAPAASESKLTGVAKALSVVKGWILLQVEKHGEAWYVSPDNGLRYYLKDGDTAYTMMRQMGLGVSNKNLEKLKAKQADLIERLKGKIVLQVENHGEAYYIHPKTGILYYLKNGEEAYKIMRNLSLGITNQNLNNIETGNLEADNQSSEVEGNLNNSNGSITLTGANHDGTIDLNWTLANMTSPNGFKVVVATHENPVYPGDDYHYLTSPDVRSDAWSDLDSGTYYFRVCEYLGGACGVYSNNYKVTILQPVSNTDGSITLTGNVVDGKINLNWTLANMTSPNGFKVVVAGHENPIYPGDTYHYLSSPTVRSDSWSDLPAGTHNFRVCEYLGGACGVYSNNLQLNF